MTLHQVAEQLYDLSVDGFFNHEHFTKQQWEEKLKMAFRPEAEPRALGNRLVQEIALPDRWWLFYVVRYSDAPDGFDYWIPDTREQEEALAAELYGALKKFEGSVFYEEHDSDQG